MSKPVAYLCVSIDCECDKDRRWRTQLPLRFAGIVEGIGNRLQPLFAEYQARPTYLLSPEVMRHEPSVNVLCNIGQACELGTHMHTEFIDPAALPPITKAFQCHETPFEEAHKMAALTNLFRSTFGRAPLSFRAGRFGLGKASLGILANLGYAVDSSVTPHVDWSSAGAPGVSFRSACTQPYWPDHNDPEAALTIGSGRVLEIPVTIRRRRASRIPGLHWLEPRWLRPSRASAAALVQLLRDEMRASVGGGAPVVLNAMFHNVEVIPGASPYAADETAASRILNALRGLLAYCKDQHIAVVGLSEIPSLLRAHG